ncbi:MAG: hypothetical protein LAT68_15300 [Cyclobacteriaceae bacterium]|nr:hypothetical protein [Cyclobacteriaceae bacterium]MCH8517687.1 hypothetical protein [Cyclobacteriaceae bacterium]
MNKYISISLTILLSTGTFQLQAQEEANETSKTILQQYGTLIDDSRTYLDNKVIKIEALEGFGSLLEEQVKDYENEIERQEGMIKEQSLQLNNKNQELKETQQSLEEAEKVADSFVLGGLAVDKSVFVVVISVLLLSLLVLSAFSYLAFIRAHKVTKIATAEVQVLKEEIEEQKKVALEKQVKLKRELQTALNKLAERG